MIDQLQSVLSVLCCPDDGNSLSFVAEKLGCTRCGRVFPIHNQQIIELVPRNPAVLPAAISRQYYEVYLNLFAQPFREDGNSIAWGAPEAFAESWVRKRRRQVTAVRPLVTDGIEANDVLCDIAAGAGYYTFAYQKYFRSIIHCDLSVDNLNYAARKAQKLGISNILFLRVDYFQPPFRRSLDRVLCLDTLIRGEAHDLLLLRTIAECLTPNGKAVVDFHNWWHNPLRRLHVLPDNFHHNRSYSRRQVQRLFHDAAIQEADFRRFVQEFNPGTWLDRSCSWAVPATRFLYEIQSAESTARHRA